MRSDLVTTTPEDSEGYNRVTTNAQTRLTVATFLATICLATFAVFLPNTLHISGFDWASLLPLLIEALVGGASVFFLLMAAAMSIVLVRLGDLNSSKQKALKAGVAVQFSKKEKDTLDNIIKLYDGIWLVNYLGLVAVLLSLPLMGFHVHVVVGFIICGVIALVFVYFRKSLRFVIFYRAWNHS